MENKRPPLNEDQQASLKRINDSLESIMDEINTYWGTDPRPEIPELVLFIEDKKSSPSRKQTEDIDPPTRMTMFS